MRRLEVVLKINILPPFLSDNFSVMKVRRIISFIDYQSYLGIKTTLMLFLCLFVYFLRMLEVRKSHHTYCPSRSFNHGEQQRYRPAKDVFH